MRKLILCLMLPLSASIQFQRPLSKYTTTNLEYLEDRCSIAGRSDLEGACAVGETVCCLVEADTRFLRGSPADLEKARELLLLACKQGSSSACLQAATVSRWHGSPVVESESPRLQSRARTLAKLNCEEGDPGECIVAANLGDADSGHGKERARLLTRALRLLRTACDQNRASDCFDLAVGLQRGPLEGDSAIKYFRKACDLGLGQGCRSASESAGSCREAVSYLRRGCGLGSVGSCTDAAWRLSSPAAGCGMDPTKALEALDEACRLGLLSACHDAAAAYLRSGAAEVVRHGAMLRKLACDGGFEGELCGNPPAEGRLEILASPTSISATQIKRWRDQGFAPKASLRR